MSPLIIAAVLVACGQPEPEAPANITTSAASPITKEDAPPTAGNVAASPDSNTPKRPNELIAAEERENEACRGGSGDSIETMKACNRRQVLLKELQDSGWCWGGADIEAEKRFVACKPGDRDYSPGAFDEPYYSEADMAELTNTQ